jgi:hypothetical protein
MCGERKKNFSRNGKEFYNLCRCCVAKIIVLINLLFSSNSSFFYDGLDKLTNETASFEKVCSLKVFNRDSFNFVLFILIEVVYS